MRTKTKEKKYKIIREDGLTASICHDWLKRYSTSDSFKAADSHVTKTKFLRSRCFEDLLRLPAELTVCVYWLSVMFSVLSVRSKIVLR